MVGSSKILTVSYGTFSCTLEGFDEPFSTMKAIAEYFRNLAAEDRYFGAEPPTPDANMLHQIAEQAIQKRVEARVEDNAVTLRQADAVADDTPLDEAEAAEMLGILNAGVNEPTETAAQMLADDAASESSADDSMDQDIAEPLVSQDDIADTGAVEGTGTVESAAEKLARLRALVAHAEDDDYIEDEHADEVAQDAPKAQAEDDAAAQIAPSLQALIEGREAEVEADVELEAEIAPIEDTAPVVDTQTEVSSIDADLADEDDDGFDLDSLTAALADEVPESADTLAEALPQEPAAEAPAEAPLDLGEIDRVVEDTIAGDAAPQAPEEQALPVVAQTSEGDVQDTDAPVLAEDVADTPRARVRKVRVIKARKDGVPAETEADPLPEVKRVAKVEPADEAAVARLMEQTDDQMNGGDTRRRLDAFTHLKAAVTAARADGQDNEGDTLASASADYRRDLAEVVRPGAAARGAARLAPLVLVSEQRIDTPAPDAGRTAASAGNLALQQEDEAIAEPQSEALAEANSFAEFADRVGAVEMNDLLEAAAAYAAHVEGRAEFTRPVIMRHVEAARGTEEFSREEGLRSFGTLLRNGTIRKLKRGKFEITTESKFTEEARAVGE